jgi:thymidylate synthase
MYKLDKQYQSLLQDILDNGVEKKDRTGTGTISVFGKQIRHKMSEGFPLLTTKKMPFKTIVTELLWFLRGDTNIKYLIDNGCNIWNGDAYKKYTTELETHYLEGGDIYTKAEFIEEIKNDENGFTKKWGELGPIYGKQWRKWQGKLIDKSKEFNAHTAWVPEQIDQIQNLINELKTNSDSRRLMVSAWNVGELNEMVLPPCHYGFQVYTRELSLEERVRLLGYKEQIVPKTIERNGKDKHIKNCDENNIPTRAISLMWNQRSVDTFLGLPFNIASYGLLLEMIAKEVNMIPDELIGNLGDVHLYSNHIEQAREQLSREPFELPQLRINNEFWNHDDSYLSIEQVKHMELDDFHLINYKSHSTIKAPLSN